MKKLFLILNSILMTVCANVSWADYLPSEFEAEATEGYWKPCLHADVKAADELWREKLNAGHAKEIVALYSKNAVMLPTLSDKILTTQEERLNYFNKLYKEVKDLRVDYDDHHGDGKHIQIHIGGAVSSGFYTFSGYQYDGHGRPIEVEIPARYTFAYKATLHGCQLITHHSSEVPSSELARLISE